MHIYECDTPHCQVTEVVECSSQWHGSIKLPRGWSRTGDMDLCDGCTEQEAEALEEVAANEYAISQRIVEDS